MPVKRTWIDKIATMFLREMLALLRGCVSAYSQFE